MSRTNCCLAIVISAVVIISGALLTHAQVSTPAGTGPGGFVKKVAGTYYHIGAIGVGDFTGLITLHSDGTWVSQNTRCCGGGDPELNGPQSTAQGVWQKTGPSQVTGTGIIFAYDPLGNVQLIARPNLVANFDADFETAEGTITTPLFLPTQDPVDPDEVPVFVAEGMHSMSKMHVLD